MIPQSYCVMKYCVVDSPDATIQSSCYAVNKLLTKISSLKTSVEDRHGRGVAVLLTDIKEVLDIIGLQRSNFDVGIRQSYISEIDQLMKRLNIFRGDGVEVDPTLRTNLFEAKGRLLLDK